MKKHDGDTSIVHDGDTSSNEKIVNVIGKSYIKVGKNKWKLT